VSAYLLDGKRVSDKALDRWMVLRDFEELKRETESVISFCPGNVSALLEAKQHPEDL
jgi:hypothetical protein